VANIVGMRSGLMTTYLIRHDSGLVQRFKLLIGMKVFSFSYCL
jgi:hypothetical protein